MKIIIECGDLLFEHYVGSTLIDTRSDDSDYDLMSIHLASMVPVSAHPGMFIEHENLLFSETTHYVDFSNPVREVTARVLPNLLLDFINPFNSNLSIFSKTLSHLYAMKYGLIERIENRDTFNFYLDWLKSPGPAPIFWNRIKKTFWLALSSMPDQNLNWSQKFDYSDKHTEMKSNWDIVYGSMTISPVVDNKLGYDSFHAKKIFQSLLVAECVLNSNRHICNMDKEMLQNVKYGKITFDEYTKLKSVLWERFRRSIESLHSSYFLGEGYSIQEAKQKEVYGISGINNLIDKASIYEKPRFRI